MNQDMEIELKDLVGPHKLSGVDVSNVNVKNEYGGEMEDCQCISFVIDGKTCTAIENPDDGYRSSMREIRVNLAPLKNTFEPIDVICRYKTDHESDILEIIDVKNDKVVLEVGTDNTDDYYPYFVCNWIPENLSVLVANEREVYQHGHDN